MDQGGYRVNGGVGFAVNEPSAIVSCSRSKRFRFDDNRQSPFGASERQLLFSCLARFCQTKSVESLPLAIGISGSLPTHRGFGSATAIRLGCLEAAAFALGLPLRRQTLALASGRGGTSGIGINTYFEGGACFDLGRKADADLLPSDVLEHRHTPPLLLRRVPMPDWPIGICIPLLKGTSIAAEKAFFQKTCPIETRSVHQTLYEALFGVFAAIIEKDIASFAIALKTIQQTQWKKAERGIYGRKLLELEEQIYCHGASIVALSSLGPGLMFLAPNINEVARQLTTIDRRNRFFVTTAHNHGRSITHG